MIVTEWISLCYEITWLVTRDRCLWTGWNDQSFDDTILELPTLSVSRPHCVKILNKIGSSRSNEGDDD